MKSFFQDAGIALFMLGCLIFVLFLSASSSQFVYIDF